MDIATAEEILATMAEDCSEYEDVCLIDTETRIISISEKLKVVGVESDEDVVRRTFRMPWKVGENDLSTFSIRINYLNAQGEGDIYTVKDMAKSGDDMTFSWLFSRHATKYRGSIRFVVCMILTDSNGIDKEWNTTLAEFTILEGLETSGQIEEDNPDAIENILLRLNKLESAGGVSDEQIGNAVNDYLTKNPIKPGATQEQAEQIEANKRAIEELQQNGAGGGITEETDPTVPAWAKADTKPKYTADEVGALPNTTVIPTVPTALKNPYPLTINGVAYDGSEAKTVTIESTGGGASVELDTTLTQYNKAADAGAVGNALAQETAAREGAVNELKEAIDEQLDSLNEDIDAQDEKIAYIVTGLSNDAPSYVNQALNGVDTDGNLFNGVGYRLGYRLSSTGEVEAEGGACTGFIPYNGEQIIRIYGLKNDDVRNICDGYVYFCKGDYSVYKKPQLNRDFINEYSQILTPNDTFGANQYVLTIDIDQVRNAGVDIPDSIAYIRVGYNAGNLGAPYPIVTFDQEIGNTNSGRPTLNHNIVVPQAVENKQRIEEVAESVAGVNQKIETVPDYVITEANVVIDKIASAQGNRTFVLAAITDLHYGNGSYTDGVKHATQALKHIDERIKLDAVAVLGDFTDGFTGREGQYANAIADFRAVNTVLNGLRFAPNLRVHGNHDFYEGHMPEILRYTNAYSENVVWGSSTGDYFYRDFDNHKLRIICLNTVANDGGSVGYTDDQAQWFADTLNLSEKDDASSWHVLIMSHQPVDYGHASGYQYKLASIIDAYVKGTSYTNGGVTCDYAGKNAATLVGNIHGHIHNLLVDRIYVGATSAGIQTDALRIATPEACYGRPNGYSGVWHEETTYDKTKNTANDTSFVVYCIDLDTNTIKAICYGAGYDRTITYGDTLSWEGDTGNDEDEGGTDEPVNYTNQIPIATDESGNVVTDGAMYTNKRWDSSGELVDAEGYFITGLIPVKIGDMARVRWDSIDSSGYCSIRAFDENRVAVGNKIQFTSEITGETNPDGHGFRDSEGFQINLNEGVFDFTLPVTERTPANTAYVAFILTGDPSDAIVTINEPID